MTARPTDVSEIGEQLYAAVEPLATQDEPNGWALLRYCDALIAQAQPVRDIVRDRGANEPGWSILLNLLKTPANALEYLAQYAGVDLSKIKRGINVLLRNEAVNPSFEYDTTGGAPFGWAVGASETVTETAIEVETAWASKGKKSCKVKGKKDASATIRGLWMAQSGGYKNYVPIAHGSNLAMQAQLNILKAAGLGFRFFVNWFKADGTTLISQVLGESHFAGETGLKTLDSVLAAPEHAAFAQVSLEALSETASQELEFYADAIMLWVTTTNPVGSIEYIDGDQPEGSWVGTPGQSASIKATPQTEEQFNELKRYRIKELKAAHRGSPSAIVKAAQQYLIGDQTVIMQERPAGNAWRLVIVTYTEETPNEQLVKEAIEEQIPAGIVLEYKVVPGADWLVIRTEYTTWQQVKEAFLTWGGVRLNQPGT